MLGVCVDVLDGSSSKLGGALDDSSSKLEGATDDSPVELGDTTGDCSRCIRWLAGPPLGPYPFVPSWLTSFANCCFLKL